VALDDADERADPTADTEEGSVARDLVARALAALSPEQRATLLLVDQLGFGYSAAAAVLGLPEGTVASRLHVARRELKRHISDERRLSA
jgi:RNA polymerase sigma-70 factor (ECF subfamily)